MKKALPTTLLVLSTLLAGAMHRESELILDRDGRDRLFISIDGQPAQAVRDNETLDLAPGYRSVRITRAVNSSRARRPVLRQVCSGTLFIPGASRVTARCDAFGGLQVLSVVPLVQERNTVYAAAAPCMPEAMPACDFDQLLFTLSTRSFERTRLDIARQAASCNYFTSSQVRRLLECFTFESTKLEFAKTAYAHTVDPGNYFRVSDALTFDSSVCELNEYIRAFS
jgi:hypothetical protein